MGELRSLETFGQIFSAMIAERGIGSDEALARKAMRLQDRDAKRINVQRKTINNWRNDRSMPRSLSDRQFQLVLKALEASDRELAALKVFFEIQLEESQEDGETLPTDLMSVSSGLTVKASFLKQNHIWAIAITCAALLIITTAVILSYNARKAPRAYLTKIPSADLSLSRDGYVLPHSNKEHVTIDQLENLSGWELYVARNEIYARKGWQFIRASSICLQNHFNELTKTRSNPDGWYEPKLERVEPSNLEKLNAQAIRRFECNVRGGQYKCNGRLNQCE